MNNGQSAADRPVPSGPRPTKPPVSVLVQEFDANAVLSKPTPDLPIAGFQTSTQAKPLILEDDDGNRAMIVFSAPERAKEFLSQYPGYSGGLLTEFSWILRRMAEDVGIALNPVMEAGFDFDPTMLAMMMTLMPDESE